MIAGEMIALAGWGTTGPVTLMSATPVLPRSPSRALLHPLWLGSLAVLALNDHVLKGAEILPSVVTGKLSDFAGMLVAPLLLAVVLRLRSRNGWIAAHIAVGVVFAAIQLSAPLAAGWSSLMGAFGFPWEITRDALDLVALPTLLVSARWLGAAQEQRAGEHARHAAQVAAAGTGMLACVATSSPEPEPLPEEPPGGTDGDWEDDNGDDDNAVGDWEDEGADDDDLFLPDLSTDVYVHNATAADQVVRIRTLAPAVQLDCDAVADDPGTLLTSPLFEAAQTWTVPSTANVAVSDDSGRSCRAAWVEVDGLPPRLLFWDAGDPAVHVVPGAGSNPSDPGELAIVPQPEGALGWSGADAIGYDLTVGESVCATQPDADRLAWSEPAPFGDWTVSNVEAGADGCFELTLQGATTETWFACVPEPTMVVRAGDAITLEPATQRGFEITVYEDGAVTRSLLAAGFETDPTVADFNVAVVPNFDCDAEVQPACGTVASPLHVSIASETFGAAQLVADGSTTTLEGDSELLHVSLVHGQDRVAVNPECAMGPDDTAYDIELVVARTVKTAE